MSYDDFGGRGDCDPCDYEPDSHDCEDCEEKQDCLDNAADFLQGVLNQLYGGEDFDEDNLERSLDKLCTQLGLKIPAGDLAIRKK